MPGLPLLSRGLAPVGSQDVVECTHKLALLIGQHLPRCRLGCHLLTQLAWLFTTQPVHIPIIFFFGHHVSSVLMARDYWKIDIRGKSLFFNSITSYDPTGGVFFITWLEIVAFQVHFEIIYMSN